VRGQRYTNPYDRGYRANWEFVFGRWDRYGVARAVFVPSRRAAHWPPWSEESAARNHRRSGGGGGGGGGGGPGLLGLISA
jgi:hypothetical protein